MKKLLLFGTAILLLIAVAAGAVLYFQAPEEISPEEVQEMLEGRYQGEVENIQFSDGIYTVELITEEGQYQVLVEAESGEVAAFDQTASRDEEQREEEEQGPQYLEIEEIREITKETASEDADIIEMELEELESGAVYHVDFALENQSGRIEIDAVTGNIQLYTLEDDTPAEPISQEEAAEIALEEFPGEIDDIDLEEQNGRLVFEIEVENDASDQDADIVIDAYTGEILSVEIDN
ncbi:PepSY domain-containing protein [Alkalicoccus daliensis]|uniref:Uncharacterized membrane protein YkoI n=1 Tax=Alkalicoccus daliensis TaxID=745820 RepID=A0A1H0ISW1_9BACI|nr:PepSY domain-containing protein [Alkalicoccus daliensis]SDO34517.1 Uncharacterized membrane protein YkoI [Alkalicoccus daliensis]